MKAAHQRPHRVGLAWAGRPAFQDDHKRSITLAHFAPLANIEGVVFYSLQKGPASAQAAQPPAGMTLIDLTADLNDFVDTAALILSLDLVIAVDTAVAHLAGAMGKPVWLLLPYDPDFRWMLEGDDTPWYPTMRLFRQTSRGDWAGVMERVTEGLRREGK